jgi:predicted Zn-dependent peptidase
LHQKLVRDRSLLQMVSAGTDDRRGPDEFALIGTLTEKAKLSDVERAFEEAIERLRKTQPTAAELTRIKDRLKHDFAFGLQSNMRRATRLGEYEVFFGDARLLTRDLQAYLDVTAQDIQRAAAQHLVPEQRNVIEVQPARDESPSPRAPVGPAKPQEPKK